jgi:hypothetical protein
MPPVNGDSPPAGWIKLTHSVGNAQTDVYIQASQICLVGDSGGAGPAGYPTFISLANGQPDYVLQPVVTVMQAISQAIAALTPTQ